jgi:hypothetical protein
MQDHLHIVVVVAFWNAMRWLKRGQVTLHYRLKVNKRSNIASALETLCIALFRLFSERAFQICQKCDLANSDLAKRGLQTAESKLAILTKSFWSKSRADSFPKNVDA